MNYSQRLASFVLLASVMACSVQEDDVLEGKLSSNGLTINLETLNFLSSEALAQGAGQTLILNETDFGDMLSAPGGAELLSYIAKCALDEGQTLNAMSTGQSFTGNLGLATQWANGSCDQSCQGWVSACLLAHANALGQEVSISPRGSNASLSWNSGIENTYSYQEAAFYGNLFLPAGQRTMQACSGIGLYETQPGDTGVSEFLQGRVCGTGACEFSYAGLCQDSQLSGLPGFDENVCASYSDGYYSDCTEIDDTDDDAPPGPSHAEVITVYLEN